jgi:hypothetical protein
VARGVVSHTGERPNPRSAAAVGSSNMSAKAAGTVSQRNSRFEGNSKHATSKLSKSVSTVEGICMSVAEQKAGERPNITVYFGKSACFIKRKRGGHDDCPQSPRIAVKVLLVEDKVQQLPLRAAVIGHVDSLLSHPTDGNHRDRREDDGDN